MKKLFIFATAFVLASFCAVAQLDARLEAADSIGRQTSEIRSVVFSSLFGDGWNLRLDGDHIKARCVFSPGKDTQQNRQDQIIRVRGLDGRTRFWYRYDDQGNLVEVKERGRGRTRFTYDKAMKTVVEVILPSGEALRVTR